VSSVPRHSEEELRQQWAFLDALVDRQAASLKSGVQDPEEDDLTVPMVANPSYLEEISTLTQRVSTLEDERTALLRRIDLAEQARVAAESSRAAAETARQAAERALAEERSRRQPDPRPDAVSPSPSAPAAAPAPAQPVPQVTGAPALSGAIAPKATPSKPRRKSWWQRIRE
jgi:hypothetical protein